MCEVWQAARELPDKVIAKTFKGARLGSGQESGGPHRDTSPDTARVETIRRDPLARVPTERGPARGLRRRPGPRQGPDTVGRLLDRWCARSRIPEFVKAGRTIRKHRDGINAAINRGLSNGRRCSSITGWRVACGPCRAGARRCCAPAVRLALAVRYPHDPQRTDTKLTHTNDSRPFLMQ